MNSSSNYALLEYTSKCVQTPSDEVTNTSSQNTPLSIQAVGILSVIKWIGNIQSRILIRSNRSEMEVG